MKGGRGLEVACALACALAAAGCGLGPGASIGDVQLMVTRDYGTEALLQRSVGNVAESETAMRLLDRSTETGTRYGGGFVQSIDGLEAGSRGGRRFDWFFYVNGVEAPVGAADYPLHGGYRVWWDYRDWTAAMRVPAVVGAYPEPFVHGYEGSHHPVRVSCLGEAASCAVVHSQLRAAGAGGGRGAPIRVLVGPWARLRGDSAAALVERGPAQSGIFAEFTAAGKGWLLQALDVEGHPAGPPVRAGMVAATRDGEEPPTWLVTGSDTNTTRAAARSLGGAALRDRYAVAVRNGRMTPLPVR